jgi:hypothetical protein
MPPLPAALQKAESLSKHLAGVSRALTAVTLSDREAWEFLVWYETTLPTDSTGYWAFRADIAHAREQQNPWPMLQGVDLYGFAVERLGAEVH